MGVRGGCLKQLRRATGRLPGACAERVGDAQPSVEVQGRERQMQDDSSDGADDLDAQLEEPVAQPGHLCASAVGAGGVQAQFLHEHVGRSGQQDAQLVRHEAAAARAVDLQAVEQFLDPVLDVASSAGIWLPGDLPIDTG